MKIKSQPSHGLGRLRPEQGEAPGFGIKARLAGMAIDPSGRNKNEQLHENDHVGVDAGSMTHDASIGSPFVDGAATTYQKALSNSNIVAGFGSVTASIIAGFAYGATGTCGGSAYATAPSLRSSHGHSQ